MTGYTVGFIFNSDLTQVALVTKTHPEWQRGRVNGIGGKIEKGESSTACIAREVQEESGLSTWPDDWKLVIKMKRPAIYVDFYAYLHLGAPNEVSTKTEEAINWYSVSRLPKTVLSNLTWMIPLAIDTYKDPTISGVEIAHTEERG